MESYALFENYDIKKMQWFYIQDLENWKKLLVAYFPDVVTKIFEKLKDCQHKIIVYDDYKSEYPKVINEIEYVESSDDIVWWKDKKGVCRLDPVNTMVFDDVPDLEYIILTHYADNKYDIWVDGLCLYIEDIWDLAFYMYIKDNPTKNDLGTILLQICLQTKFIHNLLPSNKIAYKTYLMIDENTGYVKIGRSTNPKHREKTLQSEKPCISLIYVCDEDIETLLHTEYKEKRKRGEWFDLSDTEIKDIVKKYHFKKSKK